MLDRNLKLWSLIKTIHTMLQKIYFLKSILRMTKVDDSLLSHCCDTTFENMLPMLSRCFVRKIFIKKSHF